MRAYRLLELPLSKYAQAAVCVTKFHEWQESRVTRGTTRQLRQGSVSDAAVWFREIFGGPMHAEVATGRMRDRPPFLAACIVSACQGVCFCIIMSSSVMCLARSAFASTV